MRCVAEINMKVDRYVKGAVRQFAYWFAHGTIELL